VKAKAKQPRVRKESEEEEEERPLRRSNLRESKLSLGLNRSKTHSMEDSEPNKTSIQHQPQAVMSLTHTTTLAQHQMTLPGLGLGVRV